MYHSTEPRQMDLTPGPEVLLLWIYSGLHFFPTTPASHSLCQLPLTGFQNSSAWPHPGPQQGGQPARWPGTSPSVWGWDPRTGCEELELSAAGSLVVLELQPLVQIKESLMVLSHSSVIEAELFAISVCQSSGVNIGSGGREQTGPPGLLTLGFFFIGYIFSQPSSAEFKPNN